MSYKILFQFILFIRLQCHKNRPFHVHSSWKNLFSTLLLLVLVLFFCYCLNSSNNKNNNNTGLREKSNHHIKNSFYWLLSHSFFSCVLFFFACFVWVFLFRCSSMQFIIFTIAQFYAIYFGMFLFAKYSTMHGLYLQGSKWFKGNKRERKLI